MNAASILGYGAIGLGFLLASLAYRLLVKEQAVKNPRDSILKSIYAFEFFCAVLVVLGALLQYFDSDAKAGGLALSNEVTSLKAELKTTKDNLADSDKRAQVGAFCEAKLKQYAAVITKQQEAITSSLGIVTNVQKDLTNQNALAVNDSCSGGPHGIPSNHSAEITALNTKISSDVATVSGVLKSAANVTPPH